MKTLLSNWSIMRGLRLILGVIALMQSSVQNDLTLGLIGGFLLLTAIANVGCCDSGGCKVDYSKNVKKIGKVTYEELDIKK